MFYKGHYDTEKSIVKDKYLEQLKKTNQFQSMEDGKIIDVEKYRKHFLMKLNQYEQKKNGENFSAFYDEKLAREYVEAFFEFSRNVVFFKKNKLIDMEGFRKSEFVRDIMSIECWEENQRMYFSMYSPFAHEALHRIIDNLQLFINQNVICSSVFTIRKRVWLLKAERLLARNICDNKYGTVRIAMDRQKSVLEGIPYTDLSSIAEVKPIRLFEKIVMYIANNIEKYEKELKLDVSIIGHVEFQEETKKGKEINDLILAVLNWYTDSSFQEILGERMKPDLIFHLRYYLNEKCREQNGTAENLYSKEYIDKQRFEGNTSKLEINYIDYKQFEFGIYSSTLQELIKKNDICFIIDCPWLSKEDYDFENRGYIDTFCEKLNASGYMENYEKEKLGSTMGRKGYMAELDSLYSRIIGSSTNLFGEVIRIPDDFLLKGLSRCVMECKEKKEVYVYFSEKDGVNYSYIDKYLLTRKEAYDGKSFTIIKYCNYPVQRIPIMENSSRCLVKIRLWSMLKYISVAYAYNEAKLEIANVFKEVGIGQIEVYDYLTIYRNISINLNVDLYEDRVDSSVVFLENIKSIVERYAIEDEQKFWSKLKKTIENIVDNLLREILFQKTIDETDESIRKAFVMILYSAADSVDKLIFWNKYKLWSEGSGNGFLLNIETDLEQEVFFESDINYRTDSFMDKKLYAAILNLVERKLPLNLGVRNLVYEAETILKRVDLRGVLNSIEERYMRYEPDNLELLNHIKRMKEEFNL